MQRLRIKKSEFSRSEFVRRAQAHLQKIQDELLPEHANDVVSINVDTGEYVLGETAHESFMAFRARWPQSLAYQCRADGGPATKFYGK